MGMGLRLYWSEARPPKRPMRVLPSSAPGADRRGSRASSNRLLVPANGGRGRRPRGARASRRSRAAILGLSLASLLALPPAAGSTDPATAVDAPGWKALELLGQRVEPGWKRRLLLEASESFAGGALDTPVLVARGRRSGPTLCLTAGVHGDELNGVEIVRRLFAGIDAGRLRGTVIGVPIVNLHGFRRSSRYLPDRRDLNRFFPGRRAGSSASRIAYRVFERVVRHCDLLVDLHTASFHRRNLPQVRADLDEAAVRALALRFAPTLVVHSPGRPGTLRRAATDAGIPAVTYESGEPMRFQGEEIQRGVETLRAIVARLGEDAPGRRPAAAGPIVRATHWVRVDDGGILLGRVRLGEEVRRGQVLGSVTDPVSNDSQEVRSPFDGRVIAMAVNQVVIPGFAAFLVGLPEAPGREAASPAPGPAEADAASAAPAGGAVAAQSDGSEPSS